jgi:hypothetical protein
MKKRVPSAIAEGTSTDASQRRRQASMNGYSLSSDKRRSRV